MYALNEAKVIGGKTHDVSKLRDHFANIFGVQVANIYAAHEDNRLRKKARTPFMDELKRVLIDKYNYDDEHAK
ncbi:RteC domain-containing protein [Chitinophaga sedimenti]|uniref:RteC domain-containing protein n=1 Tax=Chitinophaga sedimenti TaxID=2033606 RepID=UPI0027E116CF|nr:RteC domain-containing protein [Chitinophaga sedimenti]